MRDDELTRRLFLGIGATAAAQLLLGACDSKGPRNAQRFLRYMERRNEGIERALFRHTAMDAGSPGRRLTGPALPGYYLRDLARIAGVSRQARFVDFQSFDSGYHESWDIESALHPQTVIAYGLDGRPLEAAHGAPARLFSPIKLGYKSVKYLTRIVFLPSGNGGYWSDRGYEWYAGV